MSKNMNENSSKAGRKVDVILLSSVRKVGKAGQKVKVASGYARNFLIPTRTACYATSENLSRLDDYKSKIAEMDSDKIKNAEKIKESLKDCNLDFYCNIKDGDVIFGSIQAQDIVDELAKKGVTVNRGQVLMTKALKVLGTYPINISLYADVESEVTVNLHSAAEKEADAK